MIRQAQIVNVRPEARAEYLRLHESVWPGVEERLRASHITNYSIFIHSDLLIAYFEYLGDDLQADLDRIASDPETQAWWKLTDPCQVPVDGASEGELWSGAREVWHLE